MQDYEKLGVFYLGKSYDLGSGRLNEELILYDSKDLTTHGLCVGMTGSGKTGLCLSILEEAAIDGIPTIAVDPKGDLGNLMLTFPELRPSDFLPWVDPGEATRQGVDAKTYAKLTADRWKKGLSDWGQDGRRIARFQESVDVAIYTPGSQAGLPVSVLSSLNAPPAEMIGDSDAMRDRVQTTVSGLLALLGIQADPVRSREHILLSNIMHRSWQTGRGLDLPGLIREIQNPAFSRVGVFDLESFYPSKDRFDLAMSMNNLLASPGFAAWMEGEPLDIGKLLYAADGRPRISILSIAHLSEAERMFFVTVLLNEIVTWMRMQPGTSSLRALFYMDEIFGYFPPTAMPPSKLPMLTLLKQARAYGLGVMLATQNPVDLDYKGLSNTGTWFIGRLQTERDKMRVLDGLEGASATTGATFNRSRMEKILAGLGARVFLMHNVHEDAPRVFQTRWALSYLRGPLTRSQIQDLMMTRKSHQGFSAEQASSRRPSETVQGVEAFSESLARPVLPPDVREVFLPLRESIGDRNRLIYRPVILAVARIHYISTKNAVDQWTSVSVLAPLPENASDVDWDASEWFETEEIRMTQEPAEGAAFSALTGEAANLQSYVSWSKALANYLYQNRTLELWQCAELREISKPGESEGAFRGRLSHLGRETRDLEVEKLRKKYAKGLASIQDRVRKAEQRVEMEKSQYGQQKLQTAISIGATLVGALFGRKIASYSTVGRATTAARGASRAAREKEDIMRAEQELEVQRARLTALEDEFGQEMEKLKDSLVAEDLILDPIQIRPRKSDLLVTTIGLGWTPWRLTPEGIAEPIYAERGEG